MIEGDQQTAEDAKRIEKIGVNVQQINTGHCCHLDGHMIGHALANMPAINSGFVFIENVGNLVCPALFDLGEHYKIVMLSTTEGENKPIKYPDMFAVADVVIINKMDLLPYLNINIEQYYQYIRQINPNATILTLSATNQTGMSDWIAWLENAFNKINTCV